MLKVHPPPLPAEKAAYAPVTDGIFCSRNTIAKGRVHIALHCLGKDSEGEGEWCVHSSQRHYIRYNLVSSNAPSLGAVYGVFIAHKNVIYIILQHVPLLPHWGRCTVCS